MERVEQLRSHGFFRGAKDRLVEEAASYCRWHSAESGQTLISYTEPSTEIYLLITGSLEVEIFTESGRSIFFREVFAGELVGEISAIDRKPRSASVVARTDCTVAVLSADKFWAILQQDPLLVERLLQLMAEKIREMTDQIYGLTAFDVPSRIIAELLRMSERAKEQSETAYVRPPPTHEALAARIGTSRETVTRTLGRLAQDGLIQKERGGITIVNYAKLQELLPA